MSLASRQFTTKHWHVFVGVLLVAGMGVYFTFSLFAAPAEQAGAPGVSPTSATATDIATSPEDINQDGLVNLLDFSILTDKYNQTGSNLGRADINGDKKVNLLDFSELTTKFE